MDNDFFVPAALWLSGGNLIVALSLQATGVVIQVHADPSGHIQATTTGLGIDGVTVPSRFCGRGTVFKIEIPWLKRFSSDRW